MLKLKKFSVLLQGKVLAGPLTHALPDGHLLAITGPNGSGKTTVLRALFGLVPFTGTLEYQGQAVDRLPSDKVGYVPQRFHFPGTLPMTVAEFFQLSALNQPVTALCHQLNISPLLSHSMGTLSGGELQRVVLARALARHPSLLVLDEASAGIDQTGKTEIVDLLHHLVSDHKLSIITVTHDTAELARYKRTMKARYHELTLAQHSH